MNRSILLGLWLPLLCHGVVQAGFLTEPFLQDGGTNHMTVMWQADDTGPASVDVASDGKPGAARRITVPGPHHDLDPQTHCYVVPLEGLRPDTRYTYSVTLGAVTNAGGTFRTYPEAGKPPQSSTEMRLLWTEKGLYLGLQMKEPFVPKMRLNVKAGQNIPEIWQDDSIEIFLDGGGKRAQYVQFIVNALGAIYDPSVTQVGQASAVQCKAERGKDAWSMEVLIPFQSASPTPVSAGTVWYANFVHNRRTDPAQENQRWNTQFSSGHNDLTAFGKLTFGN